MTASARLRNALGILWLSLLGLPCCTTVAPSGRPRMPRVVLSPDGRGFAQQSGPPFVPWGFNYDHNATSQERLLEDYWDADWPEVEQAFARMKRWGATVVRIHLQLAGFMSAPDLLNAGALQRLTRLAALAEQTGVYLDVTGLASYRMADTPAWYGSATETQRWQIQARFWEAVSQQLASSPAVFCYNVMNEPAVPSGSTREWLGQPWVDGRTYVEFVTRDLGGRERWAVGRQWLRTMVAAIRKHDANRLITVGLFIVGDQASSLPLGGTPGQVAAEVDFLSVHLYPREGGLTEALQILSDLDVGKPVLIEETAALNCSVSTLKSFFVRSTAHACGWLGFFWGDPRQNAFIVEGLGLFAQGPPTRACLPVSGRPLDGPGNSTSGQEENRP